MASAAVSNAQHWHAFLNSNPPTLQSMTADHVDGMLWQALNRVQFAGELPLTRDHLDELAAVLRRAYPWDKPAAFARMYYHKPRAALMFVTMVFTARHLLGNENNYWINFITDILHMPGDHGGWQTEMRGCFRHAISQLHSVMPRFWMPADNRAVVNGIYAHAIIPQYIEDDFARLVLYWRENQLHIRSVEVIVKLTPPSYLDLQTEPLKRFLREDTYAEARHSLIDGLMSALQLQDELGDVDAVRDLLQNPIQRAIWQQIESEVRRLTVARAVVRRQAPPYWVWDLSDDELAIVLPAQTLAKKSYLKPTYITYPDDGRIVRDALYPWDDGEHWVTDRLVLPFAPPGSDITLQDGQGRVIHKTAVPGVPATDVALFRPDASGDTARLTTDGARGYADGDYVVSHNTSVTLVDGSGRQIEPFEPLYVPLSLQEQTGHRAGGRYRLRFPVKIVSAQGAILSELPAPVQSAPRVELLGEPLDPTLSPLRPPVFASTSRLAIEITAPAHIGKPLTTLIRTAREHTIITVGVPNDGIIRIALRDQLPADFGTFDLLLFAGTRTLLSEPLQFAVATGIAVESPALDTVYSPLTLPRALIGGMGTCIHHLVGTGTATRQDNQLDVVWHDLRDLDVGVILNRNGRRVELWWPIRRVTAWLEQIDPSVGEFSMQGLSRAVIHLRGKSKSWAFWQIDDKRYGFPLNARGEYRCDLRRDPLVDLLRQQSHAADVVVTIEHISWTVFRYIPTVGLNAARPTATMEAVAVQTVPYQNEFQALTRELQPYRKELARALFSTDLMARILAVPDEVRRRLEIPAMLGDPHMSSIYGATQPSEIGIAALDADGVLAFVIDREYARLKMSEKSRIESPQPNRPAPPRSRQGYCSAVDEWVSTRFDIRRPKEREFLNRLVAAPTLSYETADRFWTRIDIPMVERASRIWQILHAREDDDTLLRLDRRVFLIALALRFHAYYPKDAAEVFEIGRLELKPFVQAFDWAARSCPKLMAWAIGWAEICHHYQPADETEDDVE